MWLDGTPGNIAFPSVKDPRGRMVYYNVMVGGYPFWTQMTYLIDINPSTGKQWGCVLGLKANGQVVTTALGSR